VVVDPEVRRTPGLGSPLPQLAGALLAVLVVARFGWTAELPAWLWLASTGLLLALVDLREKLLPNRVVLPAVAGAAVLITVAAATDGSWDDLGRAAGGGLASYLFLLVMALIAPSGIGMGDVKLGGLLGCFLGWLGWPAVVVGFFLGFLVQALLGLVLLVVRRVGRRTELPFGPALLIGAFGASLLAGSWATPLG
jgi:leader peptidase (prepilin peptidase)/N-methyltransferase